MSEREQGNGGNGDGDEADHSERCGVRGELEGWELLKSTGGVVKEMLGYRWAFKGSEWNKCSGYNFLGKLCTAREGLKAWAFERLWNPEEMEGAVARKRVEADIPRNK